MFTQQTFSVKPEKFINRLSVPDDNEKIKAALALRRFVESDLKEVSSQAYTSFLDQLCIEMRNSLITGDRNLIKGIIYGLSCLIDIDFISIQSHCLLIANLISTKLITSDVNISALEARLLGQMGLLFPSDFVEKQLKLATDTVYDETKGESQRIFSILTIREITLQTPTSFYQNVSLFYHSILIYLRDKNSHVRELSSLALRAAFTVIVEREINRKSKDRESKKNHLSINSIAAIASSGGEEIFQHSEKSSRLIGGLMWYKECLAESLKPYSDMTKDLNTNDRRHQILLIYLKRLNREEYIHGNLLLLTELVLCYNADYLNIIYQLNKIADLPVIDFIMSSYNESFQSVRNVILAKWPSNSNIENPLDSLFLLDPVNGANWNLAHLKIFSEDFSNWHRFQKFSFDKYSKFGDRTKPISSDTCRRLLQENLDKIWANVFKAMNNIGRNNRLIQIILGLLPSLISLNVPAFLQVESRHQFVFNWLFSCILKDREKPYAILTIAIITKYLRSEFSLRGYLNRFLPELKACLPGKKRNIQLETAMFLSIGLMSESLGQSFFDQMKNLLPLLFNFGLSRLLVNTCQVLADNIPDLKQEIQISLLKHLKYALSSNENRMSNQQQTKMADKPPNTSLATSVANSPWSLLGEKMRPSFGPSFSPSNSVRSSTNDVYQMAAADRAPNTIHSQYQLNWEQQCANTILALYILKTFDFEGFTLAHFIRHISVNFINISDSNIKDIRLEAVSACAHHIRIWLKVSENSKLNIRTTLKTFEDILTRLLTVGTSDPEPEVRCRVFQSLDVTFDQHLSQADRLNFLFSALFDESFEVRCVVMRILGRLCDVNPACVQPQLRKIFYMTLSELDHNGSTRNKEMSSLILVNMVLSVPRFFIPYADPLIFNLIPKIRNSLPPSLRSTMLVNSVKFFSKMEMQSNHKLNPAIRNPLNSNEFPSFINQQASACYNSQAKIFDLPKLEDKGFLRPNLMNFALVSSQLAIQSSIEAANAVNMAANKLNGIQVISSTGALNKNSKNASNIKIQLLKNAVNTARNSAVYAVNAAITAHGSISTTNTSSVNATDLDFDNLESWISNSMADFSMNNRDFGKILKSLNQLEITNNAEWKAPSNINSKLSKSLFLSNIDRVFSLKSSKKSSSTSATEWIEVDEDSVNGSWSESTNVIVSYLVTIGALSSIAPYTLLPHMNELVSLFSYTMLYKTCQNKRLVSVRILGELITNLGFVVIPYKIDQTLLKNLFHLLRKEESRRIRIEVIRTLGYIGALDPLKLKIYSGHLDTIAGTGVALSSHEAKKIKALDSDQWELLVTLTLESRDEFFSVCALSTLVKVLRDTNLRGQHDKIIQTMVFIFRCLDNRAHHYFPLIMPDIFVCLRNIKDNRMQEILIKHLERMVKTVGVHVKKFADEIIDVVLDLWWSGYSVQSACIMLISTLNVSIKSEFKKHIERIIPTLVKTLINETNELNIIMLLEILPELSYNIENFIHILIPNIVSLIQINQESDFQRLLMSSNQQSIDKMNLISLNKFDDDSYQNIIMPFNSEVNDYEETIETAIEISQSSECVGSVILRKCAIECIARLSDHLDLDCIAWSIIHPVTKLLLTINSLKENHSNEFTEYPFLTKYKPAEICQMSQNALDFLVPSTVDLLTSLLYRMGQKFMLHLPIVNYFMEKLKIKDLRFDSVLSSFEKLAYLPIKIELDCVDYQSRASEMRKRASETRRSGKQNSSKKGDDLSESCSFHQSITKRMPLSATLKRAWRCSHITSRDDWSQWLRGMMAAFLRESPSPSIRACFPLIAVSPNIAKNLFDAAFVSCWPELTDNEQDDLIDTLTIALNNKDLPIEISQTLLNLEEFMDHLDKYSGLESRVKLPLSVTLLAETAMRNKSYAKALYYKEMEFLDEIEKRSYCKPSTLSNLINIYDKLQLEEAAKGVLIYAQQNSKEKLNDIETWHEKLHDWDRALSMYERKLEGERIKDKTDLILGRMRCLKALGQWNQMLQITSEKWDNSNVVLQTKMAPLAINAAWSLQQWDLMDKYSSVLPNTYNFESCLFKSIISLKKNDYQQLSKEIHMARECLDISFNASSEESYNRAYKDLVSAQMLSELEEVVQYQLVPERREIIKAAWHNRLLECQLDVDEWTKILRIHSLVLTPLEHLDTWLKFASLCRKSNRMEVSFQTIQTLVDNVDLSQAPIDRPIVTSNPKITFAYAKWLWSKKSHQKAIMCLNVLKDQVLDPLLKAYSDCITNNTSGQQPLHYLKPEDTNEAVISVLKDSGTLVKDWIRHYDSIKILTTKTCIKLGDWCSDVQMRFLPNSMDAEIFNDLPNHSSNMSQKNSFDNSVTPSCENELAWEETQNFVIKCYELATELNPNHRKAWQSWAMANYSIFNHLDTLKSRLEKAEGEESGSKDPNIDDNLSSEVKNNLIQCMEMHAAPAVRGFVNSISLSSRANLQDSLRLINLLFKFGHLKDICQLIKDGFDKIQLDNWLLVIQQLLARIDTTRQYVANLIVDLLISVGAKYPQALVYPLILAFKSGGSDIRRYNANRILVAMEQHSPRLISEGFMLNEELIRCSISWIEMWIDCLEDASRVYFGEKDEAKMFRLLHPLHLAMNREPETIMEANFLQEFGEELENCKKHCILYEMKATSVDMQQAWEAYYTLYRNFSKRISTMTSLELAMASPRLSEYGSDWQLCVPGSYDPNKLIVHIAGIKNCLNIMTSKQRPRKFIMTGSDGHSYMFLLKGHEDTRQDERVMQFFGLVNTLLVENAETLKRNLTIQRMAVVPLSTNTGLISWVSESDTLHVLVRDYREKTGIVMNVEHRKMLELFPDFDRLRIIQKTEVFEAALRETDGCDLAHILWLRGQTAEKWFEHRTNFTRSIATMSMVGYILGLGDRHPSNVLLSRETGKIIHIDFGDCFNVASMREKFPEKVPFRLTRMIVKAMEVTGIDGIFRQTCEQVMTLLRANRESLLAVLEAFIHDPLLQWVLLENKREFNNQSVPTNPNNRFNTSHNPVHRESSSKNNSGTESSTNSLKTRLIHDSKVKIFSDPNYPESFSLRDPYKVNAWRHHLCNGPWFGCYRRMKANRIRGENGQFIIIRNGLENFIFSAGIPNAKEDSADSQKNHLSGNMRAKYVMDQVYYKLTGTEKPSDYALMTWNYFTRQVDQRNTIIPERIDLTSTQIIVSRPCNDPTSPCNSTTLFHNKKSLEVKKQVDLIIRDAMSHQNLCQMYFGWCPFW